MALPREKFNLGGFEKWVSGRKWATMKRVFVVMMEPLRNPGLFQSLLHIREVSCYPTEVWRNKYNRSMFPLKKLYS